MTDSGEDAVCTGDLGCPASPHWHGCHSDYGDCEAPYEHDWRRTPWRERPDSLTRGYVAGAMAGGWVCTVLYAVIIALSGRAAFVPAGVLFLATSLLATFMWRHG